MSTLKDEAKAYKSGPANISELDKVPIDIELETEEFQFTDEKGQQKTGQNKVAVINGTKYRVPSSVIKHLKANLENNPDLKYFKVMKSGSGLNTEYTTIPLTD